MHCCWDFWDLCMHSICFICMYPTISSVWRTFIANAFRFSRMMTSDFNRLKLMIFSPFNSLNQTNEMQHMTRTLHRSIKTIFNFIRMHQMCWLLWLSTFIIVCSIVSQESERNTPWIVFFDNNNWLQIAF